MSKQERHLVFLHVKKSDYSKAYDVGLSSFLHVRLTRPIEIRCMPKQLFSPELKDPKNNIHVCCVQYSLSIQRVQLLDKT